MQHDELSYAERQFLELRLLGRWSLRRIAEEIGRDHSALSREIRRNSLNGKRYRASEAQAAAEYRAKRQRKGCKLDRDPNLAAWVEERLREGWSPEKIAGRLKWHPPLRLSGRSVSHETIYGWIYEGAGRFGGLYQCLWSRRKRRFTHKGRQPKTVQIEGRMLVSERLEDREAGHLESDSMIWREWKGLLSAQVDRKLFVCRLRPCSNRTANETAEALRRTIETLPHRFVRDFAFDNGSENANHLQIREEYSLDIYFCAPRSPWQKPQIENLNRTIRHWLPRKTKVSVLTDRDWQDIEDRLNNLPRKSLQYLTPNEALTQYLASGATRT
jgi:IS30 family transposase